MKIPDWWLSPNELRTRNAEARVAELERRNAKQQRIIENSHANNAKLRAEVAALQERRRVWCARVEHARTFGARWERHVICRWLRDDNVCKTPKGTFTVEFEDLADAIERNEHLR